VCLGRLVAVAMLGALPCTGATAAQPAGDYPLDVYLQETDGVDQFVVRQARAIAGAAFETAGVSVRWLVGKPARNRAAGNVGRSPRAPYEILVTLTSHEPSESHPGALAYAAPLADSGARVTVFYDRVYSAALYWDSIRQPALLAHVLVHEITHAIHGAAAKHTAEGMMKARWSGDDMNQIQTQPLPFTAEDIQLIREGIGARSCEARRAGDATLSSPATSGN
jgi:hypothetical protein